jgi:signal transduction histidine kinase
MTPRATARLPWVLLAIAIVIFAGAAALSLAAHDSSDVLPFLPALLVFAGVGAVVASRRPGNALGWLLLSMSGMSIGLLADAYAHYGMTRTPHVVGTAWAAWAFMLSIEVGTVPLIFILLLFPHGTLLSPRWRVVAWAAIVLPIVGGVATAISDVNFSASTNFPMLRDPVQLLPRSAVSPVYGVYQLALLLVILAAAASLVLRFHRSREDERQQLKWIAFAGGLAAGGFILLASVPNGPEPVLAFITLVPLVAVAAGFAILKYRLYDIDVVINKTVVFGALAAFITVVYVGIVVGVGALIGHGSSSKPNLGLSILATAVVAVAFQPVREWIQRFANRLVYGKRSTPYEVLSEFSSRMAGAYAAEDLPPRMARMLAEGTGSKDAEVWLKVGSELRAEASWPADRKAPDPIALADGELPEIAGTSLSLPVHHHGELLGALTLSKQAGERLTPAEHKLASDLASQAGLVLRNVRLTEELLARLEDLRASRQRLVAAQDQERRRLERNIHDGAQQQLVALAVKIRLARQLGAKDPGKANDLLEQTERDVSQALEDLRDLARGIYPPLLADQGLVVALQAQARKSPLPVEVHGESISRYTQEAEACVYFCVLEALQNVAKYAGASRAAVRLAEGDGDLAFEVEDDGAGFDTSTRTYGTGLQGMADRLAAQGGELAVKSSAGRGTTVTGRLPVDACRMEPSATPPVSSKS